jgi:uncharacterized protein (DUF58 family)
VTDLQRLLRALRQTWLPTRLVAAGSEPGQHLSTIRGNGLCFAEHREYQFGDDVRHLDWNVTARLGRPFVKVFEAERASTLMIVVDLSTSMSARTGLRNKRRAAHEVVRLLGTFGRKVGDRVGAVIFGNDYVTRVWPSRRASVGTRILRALSERLEVTEAVTLAHACEIAGQMARKPGLVAVVSDFLDDSLGSALDLLAARHSVVGIAVVDPLEFELPPAGLLRMRDTETGRSRVIDAGNVLVRAQYAGLWTALQEQRRRAFLRTGVPCVEIAVSGVMSHP